MDRRTVTEEEKQNVLTNFFKQGTGGPLEIFPSKENRKLIVLEAIMKHFDAKERYSEKEVNEILKTVYGDFALIRRALVDNRFMERNHDCTAYWVAE